MSSLACKYVFYRPDHAKEEPMGLNFEGCEMGKWNKPADRYQRVDEKNRVIYLVIMLLCLLPKL